MFSFRNIDEAKIKIQSNHKPLVVFNNYCWTIDNVTIILDYSMGDSGKPNEVITFENNKGINMNLNLSESKTMLLKETKELGKI